MKSQEEIYRSIKNVKNKLEEMTNSIFIHLSGWMQNDIDLMLEDGYLTKDLIPKTIKEMELDFDNSIKELRSDFENAISELEDLKKESIEYLEKYI